MNIKKIVEGVEDALLKPIHAMEDQEQKTETPVEEPKAPETPGENAGGEQPQEQQPAQEQAQPEAPKEPEAPVEPSAPTNDRSAYNCQPCGGEGLKDGNNQYEVCPNCHGTGKV